jgi:hypothetical protein
VGKKTDPGRRARKKERTDAPASRAPDPARRRLLKKGWSFAVASLLLPLAGKSLGCIVEDWEYSDWVNHSPDWQNWENDYADSGWSNYSDGSWSNYSDSGGWEDYSDSGGWEDYSDSGGWEDYSDWENYSDWGDSYSDYGDWGDSYEDYGDWEDSYGDEDE